MKIEIFISPGLSTTPQADALWFDTSLQSSVALVSVVVVTGDNGNGEFLFFLFCFSDRLFILVVYLKLS